MAKGDRVDMSIYEQSQLDQDGLEYKDGVVERLKETIEEFLQFSTTSDLIKVISDTLN